MALAAVRVMVAAEGPARPPGPNLSSHLRPPNPAVSPPDPLMAPLPELTLRELEVGDHHKGYLQLLAQLTVVGDIDEKTWTSAKGCLSGWLRGWLSGRLSGPLSGWLSGQPSESLSGWLSLWPG